jgi:hypothetical protein
MNVPALGVQWLKTAVILDPHHPEANQALADFYKQIGDQKQAARHAVAARKTSPDSASDQGQTVKP